MSLILENKIKNIIKSSGPIGVDEFMGIALYDPEHGFYTRGTPLGVDGAFITAPEVSQMFGEMVGVYFANIWESMCLNKKINIIELGPGRGTLMRDFLNGTKNVPGFHESIKSISMVEISQSLVKEQKKSLAGFDQSIFWCEDIDRAFSRLDNDNDSVAFIIANEFFDALPVKQFNKGGKERKVVVIDDKLSFSFPDDDVSKEESDLSNNILKNIGNFLNKNKGQCLIIDYGYHKKDPSKSADTLQAIYKHNYINSLERIGESDITYHIDFQTISDVLEEADGNIKISDIIPQGLFLEACGIKVRSKSLINSVLHNAELSTNEKKNYITKVESDLTRLTKEMGELFKVITFWRL